MKKLTLTRIKSESVTAVIHYAWNASSEGQELDFKALPVKFESDKAIIEVEIGKFYHILYLLTGDKDGSVKITYVGEDGKTLEFLSEVKLTYNGQRLEGSAGFTFTSAG
jgi:hypothetical protein